MKARKTVEEFLEPIKELNNRQKLELVEPWSIELCADHIGLQFSIGLDQNPRFSDWGKYKELLCAGAEITRSLDLLRQEYDDRLNNGEKITFVSTHPHDYLRLRAIRSSSEYKTYCGNSILGKNFSKFSDGLLENIFKQE